MAVKAKTPRKRAVPKASPVVEEVETTVMEVTTTSRIGRPPAFASAEEFTDAVNGYLDYSASDHWHLPNIAGMCNFLGITRETFYNMEKKPEFFDTIKKARQVIEDKWVQRLGRAQAGGAIFYLKNAFRDHYKEDHQEANGSTTNIFVLPREIARKHHLELQEAPVQEEAKIVEHEEV